MSAEDSKDKKDARKEAYEERDKLKARAMKAEHPPDAGTVGENWLRLARNAEGVAMGESTDRGGEEVSIETIERVAMELARSLPKGPGSALLRKLKALDAGIHGAGSKAEARYVLARMFPRLDSDQARKAINRFLKECWQPWALDQIQQVFHWMRVFYEARMQGFDSGESS